MHRRRPSLVVFTLAVLVLLAAAAPVSAQAPAGEDATLYKYDVLTQGPIMGFAFRF